MGPCHSPGNRRRLGKRCTNNYTDEAKKRFVYPWTSEFLPGCDDSAKDQPVDPDPFQPAVRTPDKCTT
jgi:hypothetical protein